MTTLKSHLLSLVKNTKSGMKNFDVIQEKLQTFRSYYTFSFCKGKPVLA